MTTRFLYQPQDGHTTCGVLAFPQRGQVLRAGALSFHAAARVLRLFDFDFFFFGTATLGLQRSRCGHRTVLAHRTNRLRQAIGSRTENERAATAGTPPESRVLERGQ